MRDGWLQGTDDPAEIELRKALDDARLRGPDDVMLRRMWSQVAEGGQDAAYGDGAAARRRRAPRWLWFASGMVSTAAVTLALSVWIGPRNQAVSTTAGMTGLMAPAPYRSRVGTTAGSMVVAPGKVRTGQGETLHLTLRGGTEAVLGSSSVMDLDADSKPSVEGGEVGFSVPHQPFGRRYVVHAGPYRVVVMGTKFRLNVDGAETHRRVSVFVDEGVVEIWDRARLARVQRGESWTSPDTELAQENQEGQTTEMAAASAPAPAARDLRHATHLRHAAARNVTRTLALSTPASPAPSSAVVTPSPAEPALSPPAPALAPTSPAPDPTVQARAALADGDVSRALTLYRALAQKGGAAGENAEYELGKILRDKLGQPGNAISAWRRYRGEHPDGMLRVETDVSIIETLVNAGDADTALDEANGFLRRYPASERRAEIARIAGDLLRTRGDCRRAVVAYQSALTAARASKVAEAAAFHRAACLVQLGDPSGPLAARDYLRAWPSGRSSAEAARLAAATVARESEDGPRP